MDYVTNSIVMQFGISNRLQFVSNLPSIESQRQMSKGLAEIRPHNSENIGAHF